MKRYTIPEFKSERVLRHDTYGYDGTVRICILPYGMSGRRSPYFVGEIAWAGVMGVLPTGIHRAPSDLLLPIGEKF